MIPTRYQLYQSQTTFIQSRYFLFAYAILRSIPNKLGAIIFYHLL